MSTITTVGKMEIGFVHEAKLKVEEVLELLNKDDIVRADLQMWTSDGKLHKFSLAEIIGIVINHMESNDDKENEKIVKLALDDNELKL
ncbi:hypothetical protein NSS71_08205 [Niallia sp. FSL W8-0951]|uniref:hypothetical protein n=1 Tax=Niallia sp. FSL W8-0951 TaxID=2954639 RepID=UPI0030FB2DFA